MINTSRTDGLEVWSIDRTGPVRKGRIVCNVRWSSGIAKDIGPLFDTFREVIVVESRITVRESVKVKLCEPS